MNVVPHASVLSLSSLFNSDVTSLKFMWFYTCILLICLFMCAGPSPFVLLEPLFILPHPCCMVQGVCLPCLYHPGSLTLRQAISRWEERSFWVLTPHLAWCGRILASSSVSTAMAQLSSLFAQPQHLLVPVTPPSCHSFRLWVAMAPCIASHWLSHCPCWFP